MIKMRFFTIGMFLLSVSLATASSSFRQTADAAPIPVTFLIKAGGPIETPIAVNGYARILTDKFTTTQVPECLDGDLGQYPVQRVKTIQGSTLIILVSQTDPLPQKTEIQFFNMLSQCMVGNTLYDKIEGATFPE
jgi:hypothetical protein